MTPFWERTILKNSFYHLPMSWTLEGLFEQAQPSAGSSKKPGHRHVLGVEALGHRQEPMTQTFIVCLQKIRFHN